MRRGDVVLVVAAWDYGDPQLAVIAQTDALPDAHASVVICPLTPDIVDAPDFRVTVEPSAENGLPGRSQVMADKPTTVRRERVSEVIGRLSDQEMRRVGAALAFVAGLAD